MGEIFSSLFKDCRSSIAIDVTNTIMTDNNFKNIISKDLEDSEDFISNIVGKINETLEREKIKEYIVLKLKIDQVFIDKVKEELSSDYKFNLQISNLIKNNINK